MAKGETSVDSCLRDEKITFKFIPRIKGGMTDNKKHVAYGGMLDTAFKEFVPGKLRNGRPKNILSDDEKTFLEKFLRLEENTLSAYNKEYWNKIKVRLFKNNNVFDLKSPEDFIAVKVLLSNDSLIAKSKEDATKRRTFLFYMEKEGADIERKTSRLSSSMVAYKLYGKYEDNLDALRYVLRNSGKITKRSIALLDAQGLVADILTSNPEVIASLLSDKLLNSKIILEKAIELKIIAKRKNELYYKDGKKVAEDEAVSGLKESAEFLSAAINQDKKFALEAEIKQITK